MKMKTANFFSLMITSAALLRGICHAEPASNGSQNALADAPTQVPSSAPTLHHLSETQQIKGGMVKNPPPNVLPLGQPFAIPARLPTKPMPVGVHSPIIRPSVIQPAGPLLTKAPDHGSTQAVIGGPVTPKIKTTATAAITGTGLNRKP